MSRLNRNASAVRAYIVEVWPRLEKPGGVPDVPFGRKHKGTTRPPTTDRALRLMDANRHSSKILAPLIRELRAHDVSHNGIKVNGILLAVEYDPAAARNWKAKDAPEETALWKTCLLLAQAAQAKWDPRGLTEPNGDVVKEAGTPLDMQALDLVVTHLEGEPDDTELQASEWQTAHNRDNNHGRTLRKEDSYRTWGARIEAIKEREDCTTEAAIGLLRDGLERDKKEDVSRSWLYESVKFCREERTDGTAA